MMSIRISIVEWLVGMQIDENVLNEVKSILLTADSQDLLNINLNGGLLSIALQDGNVFGFNSKLLPASAVLQNPEGFKIESIDYMRRLGTIDLVFDNSLVHNRVTYDQGTLTVYQQTIYDVVTNQSIESVVAKLDGTFSNAGYVFMIASVESATVEGLRDMLSGSDNSAANEILRGLLMLDQSQPNGPDLRS